MGGRDEGGREQRKEKLERRKENGKGRVGTSPITLHYQFIPAHYLLVEGEAKEGGTLVR